MPWRLFYSGSADGGFSGGGGLDMPFAVFVDVPTQPEADTIAPDTTITTHPKDKTKKKTATFEFVSSEPGSSFQRKLETESGFSDCVSPVTIKVGKGKHAFEVRATDQAGNTDPSPATDNWKVKKKRKK